MEDRSVSGRLAECWDKPWRELSDAQKQAWREAAYLNNIDSDVGPIPPEPLFLWDELTPEQRNHVAVGHDAQWDPADQPEPRGIFEGSFRETHYNGHPINWRYWMAMQTLSARQFSCLVNALDPDIVDGGNPRPAAAYALQNAKKIERLALNQGMAEATQDEWQEWADEHGFRVHQRLRQELIQAAAAKTTDIETRSSLGETEGKANDTEQTQIRNKPNGLGKKAILAVDWPMPNNVQNVRLKRFLTDVPRWLEPARIQRGAPGKASALWNPTLLAVCIHEHFHVSARSFDNHIRTYFPDWLAEWRQRSEYLRE